MVKSKKLKVVSLFDGISCGQEAIKKAGYEIERYVAFETDKYARSITRHNFPATEHKGDVTDADFRCYEGFDLVIGGSPCTFWSIAKESRELDKTGMGWMLFMRFADAVRIIKPRYYLYENVASMPDSIRDYISQEFESIPLKINSALVSAQQRTRLYWTNIGAIAGFGIMIPNIPQPNDKGIMLKDILSSGIGWTDKSYCQTATYQSAYFEHTLKTQQRTMIAAPVVLKGKTTCLCAGDYKENVKSLLKRSKLSSIVVHKAPDRIGQIGKGSQGGRIYSVTGKSVSLSANSGGIGAKTGLYKIDLPDGDYIIRKLSPLEAERCQTLPDGYTAIGINDDGETVSMSNTQRYKAIGNGWTVDVIAYILKYMEI